MELSVNIEAAAHKEFLRQQAEDKEIDEIVRLRNAAEAIVVRASEEVKILDNKWLYLVDEDKNTALAFGVRDENSALLVYKGLKSYTDFIAAREQARHAYIDAGNGNTQSFQVPSLPQDVESAMATIQLPGVKEAEMYATLVKEQMAKVQSIIDVTRYSQGLKAASDKERKRKADQKAYDINKLARENPYGFLPESQSAQDWGAAEYTRLHGSRI